MNAASAVPAEPDAPELEITAAAVDVDQCLRAGQPPAHVFPRAKGETWRVLVGPAAPGHPVRWAEVSTGALVSVPLVPYQTRPEPTAALLFAAVAAARGVLESTIRRDQARRLHVVHGQAVEEQTTADGRPVYQFHLGLAVRIR